ncbi:MAG: 5'/3'-nucleotidase SurE [Vampirovibrionales bacterium]|nr:5'/3'-nucleotidase SurE [Vampirovibrionales bacterium]
MRVLVSNDDGIHAEGLRTLVEWLAKRYDVYVSAPDRERSAMGHALTLHKPLRVEEVSFPVPVVKAYAVSGTPSDCVKIALNAILDQRPDIVVSGINHGPNLGIDVLYSGTVSAALEGAINGVPSIAVSLTNGYERHADFTGSAEFIAQYIPKALAANLPPRTILNINTPAAPLLEMAGVRLTELGRRMYTDTYERRVDPRKQVYYWLAGEIIETGEAERSDVETIRNNMISVTPVQFDLTNYEILNDSGCRHALESTGPVFPREF